ncbi:MAG TPA: anti-phage dCTP deaminase [Thermoanaerobaculia bacterium]|nr:anti-phage dCTP deaminase [Thermoanaerobaculia bacterium]
MPSATGPELVIGLVGAVGCDLPAIAEAFATALRDINYDALPIRLSHLLHDLEPYAHLPGIHDQEDYISGHMDAGNELRKNTTNDVMARLAITRIRVARQREDEDESEDMPRPRMAYVLNSLKRPEEVTKLREIYGGAFFLVSAYASRERRRDALASRLARSKNLDMRECIWRAEKLIERDEIESRVATGQDVRDTYPLADAFLNADDQSAIDASVRRTVAILFGHPFETPTIDEMGMQFAYSAALRSSDLSRQVGYAACTDAGQVLAVGTNEVAKAGGGFYWPSSPDDARDFRVVASDEPNAEMKLAILKDLLEHLKPHGYLPHTSDVTDELVSKIARHLKGSRFMAITEYGRAVHAEMGVITDAARRGVALRGSTFYGTTFPCHNCAKHVVASGAKRLVYIEPYPKSQVARLFHDSIALESAAPGKVLFEPFVGIAPPRFRDFFLMPVRKDHNGRIISWDEIKRSALPNIESDPRSYIRSERAAVEELGRGLADAGVTFRETTT